MQALQSRRLLERINADLADFLSFYFNFVLLVDLLIERSLIDGNVCGSLR